MKKTLVVLTCALAMAGSIVGQTSSPRKPSGAVRENPAADARHQDTNGPRDADVQESPISEMTLNTHHINGPAMPTGTAIRMKLESGISTADSTEGEAFAGRVTEAVVVNGKTVIPVGSSLSGHVTKVSEPRRIAGVPSIGLRPETVTLPNGDTFNITATVVDTGNPKKYTVNDEGRIKGKGREKLDNVELVGASGSGAIAGAVIGGGAGSLIGAAAGATIATGHWLFKRHSAELPAGTEIIIELSRPVALSSQTLEAGE